MIKYPNMKKVKPKKTKDTSYTSNLGMTLESDLDATNTYYLNHDIAIIHKKPTPVQIVNVDYPSRNKAKLLKLIIKFHQQPIITVFMGRYIDFDAKETKSKHHFH